MNDSDFLWDCALNADPIHERKFLMPEHSDEARNFSDVEFEDTELVVDRDINKDSGAVGNSADIIDSVDGIVVDILEARGDGVMDIIGGELWESSVLLSCYLINNIKGYCQQSTLELGCGVALPSLLLTKLALLANDQQSLFNVTVSDSTNTDCVEESYLTSCGSIRSDTIVTMTDNDAVVMDSVRLSIINNCFVVAEGVPNNNTCNHVINNTNVLIRLKLLDWNVYDPNSRFYSGEDASKVGRVDRIIGSALCYSPYHVCLAYLIR